MEVGRLGLESGWVWQQWQLPNPKHFPRPSPMVWLHVDLHHLVSAGSSRPLRTTEGYYWVREQLFPYPKGDLHNCSIPPNSRKTFWLQLHWQWKK